MIRNRELENYASKNLLLLRRAVRSALSDHYRAGEYIVYSKNGKIYRANKPGSRGTVVTSRKSKSA